MGDFQICISVTLKLDGSFSDVQDLKQSWRQTKVNDVLLIFFLCFNESKYSKTKNIREISSLIFLVKLIQDDCETEKFYSENKLND